LKSLTNKKTAIIFFFISHISKKMLRSVPCESLSAELIHCQQTMIDSFSKDRQQFSLTKRTIKHLLMLTVSL